MNFAAPVGITPNVGLVAKPLDRTQLFAPLHKKTGGKGPVYQLHWLRIQLGRWSGTTFTPTMNTHKVQTPDQIDGLRQPLCRLSCFFIDLKILFSATGEVWTSSGLLLSSTLRAQKATQLGLGRRCHIPLENVLRSGAHAANPEGRLPADSGGSHYGQSWQPGQNTSGNINVKCQN